MKGDVLKDGSYTGTLAQILETGNFKIKVIVSSGEKNAEHKDLIGNKVLGYGWDATSDTMSVSFLVNVTKKKTKKLRSGPCLTVDDLSSLASITLTRRVCLGITNGFLDFLGLMCPITIRFKLLMKELLEHSDHSVPWDQELSTSQAQAWFDLIAEVVRTGSICFPRAARPAGALGNPSLVSFGDGSFSAFCGSVYLRWETACRHTSSDVCNGDYQAFLLCAKAKVTPLSGFTVPRSEISGMVLQSRLALSSIKALSIEPELKPTGVTLLSDSECVISAVETSTSVLKPFYHNRVSEIRENMSEMKMYCPVEEIYHVSGHHNPADMATRGSTKSADLGPGSTWWHGPDFLCVRRDLWPVSRSFVSNSVPPEEIRSRKAVIVALLRAAAISKENSLFPAVWNLINDVIHYSNSILKVKNILARVVRGWSFGKEIDKISPAPTSDELMIAERLILLSAMPETALAFNNNKLDSLLPERDGMIIVTKGRIGSESLLAHLGVSSLPILMPSSRAAFLFMTRAHCGEFGMAHKGVAETLARSRSYAWIHKGRDLAKKICSKCPTCIRSRKRLLGQQMARIQPQSLSVCKPWTHVSLDFCGPFQIKGVVNARARMKSWVLVYVCRSTKAVCLLPTSGYGTQSFLMKHEEFIARKGNPSSMVSDRGTQLVSAGVILAGKDSPGSWDWSRVTRENATCKWTFVPIGSQHRNGLPEATVKVLKKSVSHALAPGVILAYDELVTLLARISYSLNQRPLGLTDVSQSSLQEDNLMPLTPNMLLLGRNSNESPPLSYTEDDRFCSRLAYITAVESQWWGKWIKEVLPTLLPCRKWKRKEENLSIGDVVLMWYPGNIKDDYRMARVVEVHPDPGGLIRTVTVAYRVKNKREPKEVFRVRPLVRERVAVQRLQLLHAAAENPLEKEN